MHNTNITLLEKVEAICEQAQYPIEAERVKFLRNWLKDEEVRKQGLRIQVTTAEEQVSYLTKELKKLQNEVRVSQLARQDLFTSAALTGLLAGNCVLPRGEGVTSYAMALGKIMAKV